MRGALGQGPTRGAAAEARRSTPPPPLLSSAATAREKEKIPPPPPTPPEYAAAASSLLLAATPTHAGSAAALRPPHPCSIFPLLNSEMAFPARGAVFRDENLQIHGGRWADAPKPLKPLAKPGLQGWKPLQDVSNVRKGTALKERSTQKVKAIKNPNKTKIFVDKETAQCQEWAKDGVESSQLTRYDY
ncbi:hypothetical protein ACP4OV_029433 [Aristida adscensionis]